MNIYSILSLAALVVAFPFLGIAIICSFSQDKDKNESKTYKEDDQVVKESKPDEH